MAGGMTIKGVTSLRKKLEEYEKKVRNERMKAMRKAVLMVERRAKQIVPVDTHRLQRDISHEVEEKDNKIFGRVGTNVEYAKYVEFGTSNPKYPIQPYLRPALETERVNIEREFGQVLKYTIVTK